MTLTPLTVAADHPAYTGHFPGAPILPGVVLLDATVHALEEAGGESTTRWQVTTAKFLSVVRPGDPLTLEHELMPNGSIRFAIRTLERQVANGVLVPFPAGSESGQQG